MSTPATAPDPEHRRDLESIFGQAREAAVEAILEEAGLQNARTSADELNAVLEREKESLMSGLGEGYRADYEKVVARLPADGPRASVGRVLLLAACAGVTAAACLLFGWATASRAGPASAGSMLPGAGLALLVVLAAGALVFGAAWLLSPYDAERGNPPDAALLASAALVAVVSTGGLTFLLYQAFGGWAVPALLAAGGVWTGAFAAPVRAWWLSLAHPSAAVRDGERLRQLRHLWREQLAESMRRLLRRHVQAAAERSVSGRLEVPRTPDLARTRDENHVSTPAGKRLEVVAGGMDDGSIALSGPRGVGKTELLTTYCRHEDRLSVVVDAPVLYERRDFALHLFGEVCKLVLSEGPRPLRRSASQHLQQIRYLQTHGGEAGIGVPGVNLSLKRSLSRTRQPLSYPEIVYGLREFLRQIGNALDDGRRLVIGIDELDRIQPATAAQDFLNELKVIFDVPGCLFLLSVSDEALRAAELAPVGGRDVFDSAIDEVIRVEPLGQEDAARLLDFRVIGLPVAFTALFNALAGGIPRDLLRIARAAILFHDPPSEGEEALAEELPDTARRLVARELHRLAGGGDDRIPPQEAGLAEVEPDLRPGMLCELAERVTDLTVANRLYFLDTVIGVFTAGLTPERIRTAERERSFTLLARTGSRIGTADRQARALLGGIREHWGLRPIPPAPD
ncbi:P-loop NTPase fold protein [Nonomuraea sp. NPDC050404]|uniref:P-loop NTPase fold protein n=1 Tax=Nonomuraea sp. NPDC050404 TaxID=3155783 RepID=UPI0033CF78A7